MAYVKVKWRKDAPKKRELSASDYEKYLLKERGSDLAVNCNNCLEGQAIDQFAQMQTSFGQYEQRQNKSTNIAFEVIQSFSAEQSKSLKVKNVNDMGAELAKRYFPDHQFMVVTHSDTNKLHNHILVNPVNHTTGKRDITDKKKHLYNLRSISNEISLENGLSIIKESDRSKEMKLPQEVREMNRRGAKSRRMDLFQKANMARDFATSFDEYSSTLSMFQVRVAITDKNITYFYGDAKKGIRGNKLGKKYDKDGLISQFKQNDQKFAERPNLRRKIEDGITAFKNGERDALGVSGSSLLGRGTAQGTHGKDYNAFTKSDRRGDRTPTIADHKLYDSIIPTSEIKKARNSDIFAYCKQNKIKTTLDDKGQRVLKGREHIVINGSSWKNTKNKTVGSLIEFVAFKDDSSYLSAISKITGNTKLMLLEQHYGKVKRPYTSFYIPKEKQADINYATKKVSNFLRFSGIDSELSKDLFKLKKVQVDKKGSIWLFPESNGHSAIEFTPNKSNGYNSKNHGAFNSFFHSSKGSSKNVTVFTDPFSYMKSRGADSFDKNGRQSDVVLMGLNEHGLDLFLTKNPHVKSLDFANPERSGQKQDIFSFVNKMKKRYQGHSISVDTVSFGKIDRSHGHGLDIDF
ncbi:MAG: relaxase/mobilization nuclease domain-containing protein [Bdellovibrionaceae bacterium]|jgi:hypothetical protein|nr:relaxase/mobilization nuclease domain-containing protein [Pseudobdellovibrionaceae bacterium]